MAAAPTAPAAPPEDPRPFCLRPGVKCACATDLAELARWVELQPKDPPRPPLRRLEGELYFRYYRPVGGAKVFIVSDAGVQALVADPLGLFSADAPTGRLAVIATAPGLLPMVQEVEPGGHAGFTWRMESAMELVGTVTRAGAPVAGATVRLGARQCQRDEALTDAGGAFRMRGVAPGFWDVAVEQGGDRRVKKGWLMGPRALAVDLAATGVLQGKVFAPAGTPAAGAAVRAVGLDAGAISDAEGDFQLELPVGPAELEVTLEGWLSYQLESEILARDTQVPYVVLERPRRVTGVVEGPEGPVEGASLALVSWSLHGGSRRRPLEVKSEKGGQFAFDLPPHWATTSLEASFGELQTSGASLAGREDGGVRITLGPPAPVSGRVVDASGAPASGARVELLDGKKKRPLADTTADAQGAFVFWSLPTGATALTARKELFSPLLRTSLTGRLELEPGGPRRGLAVTVAASALSVEGVVKDDAGKPLAGAMVALEPVGGEWPVTGLSARGNWYSLRLHGPPASVFSGANHMLRSAADGTFAVAGLEPRDYFLVADHPDYGVDLKRPARVKAGQKRVEVALGRKPRIVGKVVGAQGTLPWFHVDTSLFTGSEGDFELVRDQSGPTELSFSAPGHALLGKRYVLKPGQTLDVGVIILELDTAGRGAP